MTELNNTIKIEVLPEGDLKFNKQLLQRRKIDDIRIIILHHRGGQGNIQSIHAQHLKQGWAGIGYNYYIRFSGAIQQGRPIEFVPSHCVGNNGKSIGICLEGDFRKQQPTKLQMESLRQLVAYLKGKHPNINKVLNHNDLYATQCPVLDLKVMI